MYKYQHQLLKKIIFISLQRTTTSTFKIPREKKEKKM